MGPPARKVTVPVVEKSLFSSPAQSLSVKVRGLNADSRKSRAGFDHGSFLYSSPTSSVPAIYLRILFMAWRCEGPGLCMNFPRAVVALLRSGRVVTAP